MSATSKSLTIPSSTPVTVASLGIVTATDRAQLGTGTNSTDNTFQFKDSGSITASEIGALSGVTSPIQTQINSANANAAALAIALG